MIWSRRKYFYNKVNKHYFIHQSFISKIPFSMKTVSMYYIFQIQTGHNRLAFFSLLWSITYILNMSFKRCTLTKFAYRLESLKAKFLSFAGKIALVKSVRAHLQVHTLYHALLFPNRICSLVWKESCGLSCGTNKDTFSYIAYLGRK